MNKMQSYYINGFSIESFLKTESLERILACIRGLHTGSIRTGFMLEEKYKNSKDLRPFVYEYDPAFFEVLFENDIPKILKDRTGLDLFLAHIQLRISYPGESYMNWHRDTHMYHHKLVGNIPPVHKIIFYPEIEKRISKLHVIPGSHHCQFSNRYIDMLQARLKKNIIIESSNDHFILFNTTLLHAVEPETFSRGSWRLIYSFVHEFQLQNFIAQKPLIDSYRNRISI